MTKLRNKLEITSNDKRFFFWHIGFPIWISSNKAIAIFSVIVLLGSALGVIGAIYNLNMPTGVHPQEIIIKKGMTVVEISHLLNRKNVIQSPRLLQIFSLMHGTSRNLTAGRHLFQGTMSTWQVLQELEISRDITRDVTLPEGLRLEQTIHYLVERLSLDDEKLLRITTDPDFCREQGIVAQTLEGYLFPETYRLSLSMNEHQVVKELLKHFFKIFNESMRIRAQELNMSIHEITTLASIIEGEVQVASERRLVSAVYHNRLKKRMRLQADPTVQFSIVDGPRRLFNRDYLVDSPYNTYLIFGLPPGPVMSPGKASLEAALYPADVDFLYFVAKGDGSHIFSITADEHEIAKKKTKWSRQRMWQQKFK